MAKELNGQGTIFKRYRKDIEPDSPRDGLTLATASEEIVYDPDVFAKIEELITEVAKEASLATIQTILNNLATEETLDSVSKDASVLALTTLLTQRLTDVIATENSLNTLNNKIPSQVNSKLPVDVSFPNNQAVSISELPLPTGASTESTLQALRNRLPSDLIGGKLSVKADLVNSAGSAIDTGSGIVTPATIRTTLALDGPTVQTLTNLLNATRFDGTEAPLTLTFTIASGASLSDYKQLKGRSWLVFFPPMLGANVKIKVKADDGIGYLLRDENGNPHEFPFVSSTTTYAYSAQATAFLSSCIKSEIAFESYDDATTLRTQASAITIILKAVVA